MKCYVCGKQYEGNECPRCAFPAVEIPNTTWEQGRQALAATITPSRAAFLKSVEVSLVIYHYRDENGVYVLDREFARLEGASFSVRLRLSVRGQTREELVELPNLKAAELQNIGICMDDQFNIRLKLRNASEMPTTSAPVEL